MNYSIPVVADSLSLYLAEIKRFSVLATPEEEHHCAVKFYEEKDLEAAQRSDYLQPSIRGKDCRRISIIRYEDAGPYTRRQHRTDDGSAYFQSRTRVFDLFPMQSGGSGVHSEPHHLRLEPLKIGTTQAQRKLFFKLNQAKSAIRNVTGEGDDLQATADALDVKESEVLEMDQRMRGDFFLDAEVVYGEGLTMLESLPDERQNQEELLGDAQEDALLEKQVASALTGLNEKERYVIEQRVSAEDPLTLQEIADHFSISRERVRQIEEGALKKMKHALLPWVSRTA